MVAVAIPVCVVQLDLLRGNPEDRRQKLERANIQGADMKRRKARWNLEQTYKHVSAN